MTSDQVRPSMSAETPSRIPTTESAHLVVALLSVDGTMAACADHGDPATFGVLSSYYALVASTIADAEGRVVKVMGDGMLLAFPRNRAADAVAVCQQLQSTTTAHWRAFDPRCRARVVIGAGQVLIGRFGPPGAETDDLFGHALNQLFRAPPGELVLLPAVDVLLR